MILLGADVDPTAAQREAMVREQIAARGVRDPRVLEVLRRVPRHLFVPEPVRDQAYEDRPLPIGHGQTISQPYVVAAMTEALEPEPGDRVLEVGTGSGYQAAVLAGLVSEVHTIEIVPELAEHARQALRAAGVTNVRVVTGDGYRGLPDAAPFDGIVVTAAPEEVPPPARAARGGRAAGDPGGRGLPGAPGDPADRGRHREPLPLPGALRALHAEPGSRRRRLGARPVGPGPPGKRPPGSPPAVG